VFDNLQADHPKNHFTVGIDDDVTHTSLAYDAEFSPSRTKVVRALFYGLARTARSGANKNSIKIIGENTDNYAQGYFVYDSEEGGRGHHLALALRPEADSLDLSGEQGQLRRLPSADLPGPL